ncbi:MAG: hypothetical protein KC657_18660 [Myxococcales bacterium]|nr:hypothetical protein [Myxococcales bacterium]
MRSKALPLLLACLPATLLLVSPGVAYGQQLNVPLIASLPRFDANGASVKKRALALNPEGISLQDCRDDIRVELQITASGFVANDRVEFWASRSGQDCGAVVQRSGATQQCWKVLPDVVALQQSFSVRVPLRAVIADDKTQGGAPVTPTADICGKIDAATFQLQLLYIKTSSPDAVSKVPIDIKVDTVGPQALSGVRVLPGDTRLRVSWAAVGEGGVTDQTGVKVYCVPVGQPIVERDGGFVTTTTRTVCDDASVVDTSDADADGGVSDVDAGCREVTEEVPVDDAPCSAPEFTPADGGTIVPDNAFAEQFLCGEIAGTQGSSIVATSFRGGPLVNGQRYAVAVAATDSFTNVGSLSAPLCVVPEETTDFFRDYNRAGGKATGCSSTSSEAPAGSIALGGLSLAIVTSLARRRARRRQGR